MCEAYFESKQILIMGVLSGVDRMCRKALAMAESSAVLFVSTVAPMCSGSAGVMETGPHSWVCVSVESGESECAGWVKWTPQPADREVPYRMLARTKDPSVYTSARVLLTKWWVGEVCVSCVGASEWGGECGA